MHVTNYTATHVEISSALLHRQKNGAPSTHQQLRLLLQAELTVLWPNKPKTNPTHCCRYQKCSLLSCTHSWLFYKKLHSHVEMSLWRYSKYRTWNPGLQGEDLWDYQDKCPSLTLISCSYSSVNKVFWFNSFFVTNNDSVYLNLFMIE